MTFLKLNIQGIYSNLQPIKPSFEVEKKELKSNDYLKLFGALSFIANNNAEEFGMDEAQQIGEAFQHAFICSDELQLNDGEGYELNERLTLKTLYLNQYDVVMMSVYDNKKDRFISFVA